jgi:branched-subunit amino acid ABC-type transport system permease component
VVEFLSGLIIAPAFKYAFVFLIYLLVVFIKPMGLFGRY